MKHVRHLVAAAAAALLVAACGGSGGAATTSASSRSSATGTAPASTSTVQLTAPGSSSSSSTATTSTATSSTSTSTPGAPSPSGGAGLAPGFGLSSTAFKAGGAIPSQYTCDGQDISPPLRWSGVPAGAKELVLVIRDPDAPTGNFVHWAVAGIAPGTSGFPAGGVNGQIIPGKNSFASLGYRGPCPPTGAKAHNYVFTLSALATPSGLHPGFSADQLQSRALGIATLTGTYARP